LLGANWIGAADVSCFFTSSDLLGAFDGPKYCIVLLLILLLLLWFFESDSRSNTLLWTLHGSSFK